MVNVGMSGSPKKKGRKAEQGTLGLPGSEVLLGGTIVSNGGPLGDSVEHHVTVSNFTAPVAEREGVDSAHASAVTNDIAVAFDLQQERSSYFALSMFRARMLHEEDAPFVIELDFSIDEIRSCDPNRLAAGFLRYHVDRLLRKRVP